MTHAGKSKMEVLTSKPLLHEVDQSHLQKVLAMLVQSVDSLDTKQDTTNKTLVRLEERITTNTNNIMSLEQQMKALGKGLQDARIEKDKDVETLRWDIDELRKNLAKQQDENADMKQALGSIQNNADGKDRKIDQIKADLLHQLTALQRDNTARNTDVNDAMNDLASRVDGKIDEHQFLKGLAAQDEVMKRQSAELEATRRTATSAEETAKKLANDLEQVKLTTHSRERALEDQLNDLENSIEPAMKRAQAASDAATRSELEQAKEELKDATRHMNDQLFNAHDRLNRQAEDQAKNFERAVLDVDRKVQEGLRNVNNDKLATHDAVSKVQNDISDIKYMVDKADSDLRNLVNRLRDDTDTKLLELLNAVQNVEHAKSLMDRQVAEAGRILASVLPHHAPQSAVDSPNLLKARLDANRPRHGGVNGTESMQPQSPTDANGQSHHYKASPAQGALCSCDDDIF
eukprot:TRINITY_DN27469_c0_g1_i1.p1 TRINITY_DN27469_c0_g1~~TRINITY_DN27469_c0_g1_i1.p1  ORF type:complete len:478 (+),score=109.65 TRINITY_DN27469_c0_g1_i1:53-1435(+)